MTAGSEATTGHSTPPLVSIALATYNGERFLEALLASIERQDYPSIEIIVSDDGSTDGTRRLLAERTWTRPHRIVPSSERAGVIGNFSRALAHCGGHYIALSDQDDHWHPQKISALVARASALEAESGDGPVLVFSDIEVVDADLAPLAPSFFALDGKSTACDALRDFLIANHVPGCSMLFNARLLAVASPIPTDFHMHDWWLIMVAAALGRVGYVDRPLLQYRQHAANVFGATEQRSTVWTKLSKMHRLSAWTTYLLPSEARIRYTAANLRCFRTRFDGHLPLPAQMQLDRFVDGGRSIGAALRHCLTAKTGESLLYSFALQRAVARTAANERTGGTTPPGAFAAHDATRARHR